MDKVRLAGDEIERRLPVWTTLAELFLDTQLQPADLDHLAETLNRTGLTQAEIRRILEQEVAPAFMFNLFEIAGEWAPWAPDFVRARVLASMATTPPRRLAEALNMIAPDWSKLERRLTSQAG